MISNYFLGWKEEGRNLINDNEFDGAGANGVFAEMYNGGMSAVEEDHAGKKINIMILCLMSNSDETMQLVLDTSDSMQLVLESSESIAAPLETSNAAVLAGPLTFEDALLNALETSDAPDLDVLLNLSSEDETSNVLEIEADVEILNSDSDSEILMVNTSMVILL